MDRPRVENIVDEIESLGFIVQTNEGRPTEIDREFYIYSINSNTRILFWNFVDYDFIGELKIGHKDYPIAGFWQMQPRCTINSNHIKKHLEETYNVNVKILESYSTQTEKELSRYAIFPD